MDLFLEQCISLWFWDTPYDYLLSPFFDRAVEMSSLPTQQTNQDE